MSMVVRSLEVVEAGVTTGGAAPTPTSRGPETFRLACEERGNRTGLGLQGRGKAVEPPNGEPS